MNSSLSSTLLSTATSLLPSSPNPGRAKATLAPHSGAPLSNDASLIPAKYQSAGEKRDEEEGAPAPSISNGTGPEAADASSVSIASGIDPFPQRPKTGLVGLNRAPPSQLMDAPARAAMSMPNGMTSHGQARAVRGGEARTPEYDVADDGQATPHSNARGTGKGNAGIDGAAAAGNQYNPSSSSSSRHGEDTPLVSPVPRRANGNFLGIDFSGSSSGAGGSRSSSRSPTPRPGSRNLLQRIFIDRATTPSQHLTRPTFPPPSLSTYSPFPPSPLTPLEKLNLFINQLISVVLSTFFLTFVVAWAIAAELAKALPKWVWPEKPRRFPWDDDKYWRKEGRKISKEPRDYARQVGLDIENQVVETEDGYFLRMHKVIDPSNPAPPAPSDHSQPRKKGGFPVLILHGLFQSSGSFVTSEDRSLAFWLAKQGGYQVYLGNTRGIFDMGHRSWGRNDPRFWDWTIRELAMYDLPAMVEHVCQETGYDKIAFIGHSQGNGLAFISLSLGMCPSLGKRLSVFIALAPAVYAGPLTTGFPFTTLNRLEWSTWKRIFGTLDFIPLMRWAYDYAPAKLFAMLGYTMFAFLFSWTDTNWLRRRKTKMFRFTPTPVSSASIFWWCGKGGFADRKCTLDDTLDRWFDERFPPLSIYHGGRDFLVLAEPLIERLKEKEKSVNVIKVTKLDASEHCDFYWAAEAVEWAYESFRDDIERTRPKEEDVHGQRDNGNPLIQMSSD